MRTFVAASLVLVIAVSGAAADEFAGFVTKFEDGKITVKKSKCAETPEEVTLKVADKVKIVRGKVNLETMKIEAGEAFEGGKDALAKQVKETAERVKKYIEEGKKGFGLGVFASIVTDGDTVTEIRVTGGGKKKQNK
jgi:plastocyanin